MVSEQALHVRAKRPTMFLLSATQQTKESPRSKPQARLHARGRIEIISHIGNKLATQPLNKDPGLLLSLPIGFEMEPHTLRVSTFKSLFTNTAAGQI